jgi:hypothetical protein
MTFGWNETGGSLPFGPKPHAPQINWKDPLTAGLVFAVDYGVPWFINTRDLVANLPGTLSGTSANFGPFGGHRTFLSTTDQDAYTLTGAAAAIAGGALSMEIVFKPNVNTFSMLCSIGGVSGGDGEAFMDTNWGDSTNTISCGFGRSTTSGAWKDTNGVFTFNQFVHCLITYDGSSTANAPSIYRNGQSVAVTQTGAPSGTRVTNNGSLLVGGFPGQSFGSLTDIEVCRVYNIVKTPQDAAAMGSNPWRIYKRAAPYVVSSLPAQTYSVSITETGTAADTVSDTATLPNTITEAGTAAETMSDSATLPSTITEAGTAADTISNGSTYAATITEAGNAADTVSDVATLPNTITEAGTAADTVNDVATLPSTITEAASALDHPSTNATLPSTVTEAGAASDTVNSAGIISVSVAESVPISDTVSSKATMAGAIVEQANAQDTEDAGAPPVSALVEQANATDSYSATVIVGVSIVETASAADAYGAALIIPAALLETMTAADVVQARADLAALLLEIANAQDITNSILNASLSIVETANAADTLDASRGPLIPSKCDSLKGPFIVRSLAGPPCGDCE